MFKCLSQGENRIEIKLQCKCSYLGLLVCLTGYFIFECLSQAENRYLVFFFVKRSSTVCLNGDFMFEWLSKAEDGYLVSM